MNMIRGFRVAADLTQDEMAKFLGMSRNTYIKAEDGKREFTKTEMEAFTNKIKEKMPNVQINDIFFN